MLLGTEEQVLAAQVMEEVLPWLQSQLQSRVKGKKTERVRQWLATVQATYTLVLEQLTVGLEALRGECRQTATANQAQIRSNLDQIMSSHCFLEEKIRASICDEAENVCNESIAPYMSSILEALTENISTAIQAMQHTLQTRMDAALRDKNGGTEETKVLSTLCSINLDQCYKQVENLSERLKDLKQRFGLNNTQRLIHSVHMEMEKLLDSAVYTLELFLQSSARLQPSQVPVKMERAKERVLKQLDYDSRIVQRRLYHEALLEITLPALTKTMDKKWKTELQQFEQYIFSDYSSFILIHNVYDDVLRNILSKEIETAVQDAASKKSNNLFLDTSDLAISQYSLLGQTPPRSAPGSPAIHARDSSCVVPAQDNESAPTVEEENQKVLSYPEPNADAIPDPSGSQTSEVLSPVIVVTQEIDASVTKEDSCIEKSCEDVHPGAATPSAVDSPATGPCSSDTDPPKIEEPPESPDTTILVSPDRLLSSESTPPSTDVPADSAQSDRPSPPETSAPPDHTTSDQGSEESPSPPPSTDSTVKMSLVSLSEAIVCNSAAPVERNTMVQQSTDRAVYLTGDIRDNWEMDRVKEENQKEAAEKEEVTEKQESEGQEKEKVKDEEESEGQEKEKVKDEEEAEGQEKEKDEGESEGQEEEKVKDKEEVEGQEKEKVKDKEEVEGQEEEKVKDKEEVEGQEKDKVKDGESEGQEKEKVKDKEESEEQEKEKVKDEEVVDGQDKEKVKDEEEVEGQDKEKVTEKEEGEGQEKEKVKDEEESDGQHREKVTDNEERDEQETENAIEKEQTEEEEKEMTKEASGESCCRPCESPAEDAVMLTPSQVVREEEVNKEKTEENEKKAENQEDRAEKDANIDEEEEAVLQPIKSQPEGGAELPLDSVAVIRGLVTEVIEVETIVSPCPDSSFAP
uniref:Niban 1/2/3 domain-containing protein n=3 Tax=Sphaeramia orbicularis TaxID=375764 RepID=A0A673BU74_9TELE